MLLQGNKKNSICVILSILFFVSCDKYKIYNEKEINEIREKCIEKSKSIVGISEYFTIYSCINDSINNWRSNHVGYYQYMGISKDYLVDSILCFNLTGNKLLTAILQRQLLRNGVQDDIWYFYGVKIKEEWYFFPGPTLVLPREFYQEDIHTPLSFEKLQQIATAHIYRGYLKQGKKGQWEINERFFQDIISKNKRIGGYGSCLKCKTEEEYVLYRVRENWQ